MERTKNEVGDFKLNQDDLDKWFEDLIDDLKSDHFMLSEDMAPEEKKQMYKVLMSNDAYKLMEKTREQSTMYFVKSIVQDYIKALSSQKSLPVKLALGLSDSKILVWSEIQDDNEDMQDALLLAEAKVNSKYHNLGFYINSTIIEQSDKLDIPPHYQKIIG